MKDKSKNIIAKNSAEQQIQAMTWDEILARVGKPISQDKMFKNLREAKQKTECRHKTNQ